MSTINVQLSDSDIDRIAERVVESMPKPVQHHGEVWLNAKQGAEKTGRTARAFKDWCRKEEVRWYKKGKEYLYNLSDIDSVMLGDAEVG